MNDLFIADAPNYASTSFPTPRPFQDTAHSMLRDGIRAGHKNQFVMAPTGAGKLYLGMRAIQESLSRGKRAIFVADRTTLINQASEAADRYGLGAHGIMQADHPRTDSSMPFQICSAQTMQRRKWPDADLIVIDEAHTQLKAWTSHIQDCRAKVIGLSATPFSKGLGLLFTNLINATTAHQLTQSGVLVPMKVMSCVRPDMTGAETSGGEWTEKAAEERGMGIIGDVVSEWAKHACNRKTICFGATIAHCEELAKQFNECGINAALFTSHTKPEDRAILLNEYRKPDSRLRVLISVEALAKGFDVPDVGCICDCRPLRKSLSTAIQMWGRGLRSHPGKENCLLLDFSGNIIRFAADYSEIFFNGLDALDAGEKLDSSVRKEPEEKTAKACPACGNQPFCGRCMSCGFEAQKESLIASEIGIMRDVIISNGRKPQSVLTVWEQACTYARSHSAPDKQEWRAYHIYREIVGDKPRGLPPFSKTRNVPITADVRNKILANNIRYAKSRRSF